MRKLLLSSFALCMCFAVTAQNARTKTPLVGVNVNKAVKISKPVDNPVNLRLEEHQSARAGHNAVQGEFNIGNSTYDLQSNYGGTGNRVRRWSDGTISAIWTFSAEFGTYSDRGTGYNYYDGTSWGPLPTARQESVRTGFPNLIGSSTNGEGIICHQPNIYGALRSSKGSGAYTEASLPFPSAIAATWPRATCGGANGQTIHAIANNNTAQNGQLGELLYWRSPDFGVTWDIQEYKIPHFDATNIIDPGVDAYDMDARGDVIAIVTGGFANDLILAKSTDNGTTWTKRVVYAFPIPLYDQVGLTDLDGDGVADTCDAADSSPSVVIDNNNQVHVWCGSTRIINDGTGLGYFPISDGLYYWNESFPDNTLKNYLVAQCIDVNGNGTIDLLAGDPGIYQTGLTSMASGAVCFGGTLYVVYTSLVEGTTNGAATPQTYRDVYLSTSTDGGLTWSLVGNLTQTDFEEEAFTCQHKRPVDKLDMIYYRDSEPGTSLGQDADPITVGDVWYRDEVVINCSVGIAENSASVNNISVYPNPASGFVTVNYSMQKAGLVNIDIINVMGAVVSHHENAANAGANKLKLDISKITNGVYTVKTTVGTDVFTNTIVKK
ncbi:MAG: T9SS type A sorting domain-containing protein [Bacteroidia bacterium]